MEFIEWQDEYSVNVKLIDDQHKYFVSILNSLYEKIQKGDSSSISQTISELVKYAVYHFDTEEKYFDEFGYEGSAEHKAEHEKLKAKVGKFLERKDEEPLKLGFELLDFLEDWLIQHLAEQDKKYSKCFNDHGLV